MSFVSKGDKKLRNMAKKAGAGADKAASTDRFGRKGEREMHNSAPGSKDRPSEPVSGDAEADMSSYADQGVAKSSYDPASGKRAKSTADLRNAAKLLSERSDAGSASPTGKEGGQDAKHMSSSKNASGYMKTGLSAMDKKMKKAPGGLADQMSDEMEDPMDEDQEDNEQTKSGMTPKGKSRKGNSTLRNMKRKMAIELD